MGLRGRPRLRHPANRRRLPRPPKPSSPAATTTCPASSCKSGRPSPRNDARLVVLDSLGGLFSQYDDAGVLRRELVRLRNVLQELGCTGVMTAERIQEHGPISKHGVEDFVADCVIVLRQELIAERVRPHRPSL